MFCRVSRVPCIMGLASGDLVFTVTSHHPGDTSHWTLHHFVILRSSYKNVSRSITAWSCLILTVQVGVDWIWPIQSYLLAAQYDHIMYVTIKSLTMFMSHFLISLIHLDHLDLMKWPGDRTWDRYNCSFEGNTGNVTINPKSSVHKV